MKNSQAAQFTVRSRRGAQLMTRVSQIGNVQGPRFFAQRAPARNVQGEVDATRFDIAARVDGRVADIPVVRGQDVAAGAVVVKIDNPETIAKHEQALAAKIVGDAQLANINVGTRPEVIAARKAALERAQASVVLAQKTMTA
jgi:HlyD family secretion protein